MSERGCVAQSPTTRRVLAHPNAFPRLNLRLAVENELAFQQRVLRAASLRQEFESKLRTKWHLDNFVSADVVSPMTDGV